MVISNAKPNVVLGLDLSTNSFAFGLFSNGSLSEWGEIGYRGKGTFERLADAQSKLTAFKGQFSDVEQIIFEGAMYIQNKKTVILMAYAIGSAVSTIVPKGCDIIDVSPVTWQAHIGNKVLTKTEKDAIIKANPGKSDAQYKALNRNFRKKRTLDIVNARWGTDIKSDNVGDAVGIGMFGAGL